MENFHLNLDEICIVENDGSLMIIGGRKRKKHEKWLYESHLSLMLIRIRNGDGNEVPWIFLYKVNSNPNKSLSDVSLVYQYGTPVGLYCHPNPNAYLTDNTWLEISTSIAKVVHAMTVIRDHPDWWLYLSLDGFVYHVNVYAANENFTKLNI